ncbi:pirin family protein [Epidermidibacterium keratini]|uniref:Pirin family protein n=1 Tax=Epidermidibacterium keratini TaxID=1891644 RepID=A0A7L4YPW1_9ACTN|nr:pirin family protein [Epidermidibacterium keratini]QHC00924.1 pirin family protein [Epidermidibacterium keratini]
MSNTETHPSELTAEPNADMDGWQVLQGRDVPLGGPRAMTVRRTLPHRDRSFVGAWCFADHYGPDDVASTGGMDVAPHPHTGLQTVSWLFEGEIEHRDSGGNHGMVLPGEVNLMTGGHGICHSEVSTPSTTTLHGVQLWVALPEEAREAPRAFEHFAPELISLPTQAGEAHALVFLGELAGTSSPVLTHTPLLGAELRLGPHARLRLDLREDFEYGVLLDTGSVELDGIALHKADLACRETGPSSLELVAGEDGARLVLLGGPPFEEEIVMWWNFVGRTHEDIEKAREQWQAESERFGEVEGYVGKVDRLPAPALPGGTLRARGRRGKV